MLKYKEIAQDLRDKIVNGIYKVNEQLPFEREMSIDYDVSRITIRKAVDLLVAEGIPAPVGDVLDDPLCLFQV